MTRITAKEEQVVYKRMERDDMYKTLILLGILILIGPFLFGYSGDPFALGTHLLIGGLLLLFLAREVVVNDRERWEYWLIALLGFSLIGMPFLLGFSSIGTALWMGTVSGMLLVILSAIRLSTPSEKKQSYRLTSFYKETNKKKFTCYHLQGKSEQFLTGFAK